MNRDSRTPSDSRGAQLSDNGPSNPPPPQPPSSSSSSSLLSSSTSSSAISTRHVETQQVSSIVDNAEPSNGSLTSSTMTEHDTSATASTSFQLRRRRRSINYLPPINPDTMMEEDENEVESVEQRPISDAYVSNTMAASAPEEVYRTLERRNKRTPSAAERDTISGSSGKRARRNEPRQAKTASVSGCTKTEKATVKTSNRPSTTTKTAGRKSRSLNTGSGPELTAITAEEGSLTTTTATVTTTTTMASTSRAATRDKKRSERPEIHHPSVSGNLMQNAGASMRNTLVQSQSTPVAVRHRVYSNRDVSTFRDDHPGYQGRSQAAPAGTSKGYNILMNMDCDQAEEEEEDEEETEVAARALMEMQNDGSPMDSQNESVPSTSQQTYQPGNSNMPYPDSQQQIYPAAPTVQHCDEQYSSGLEEYFDYSHSHRQGDQTQLQYDDYDRQVPYQIYEPHIQHGQDHFYCSPSVPGNIQHQEPGYLPYQQTQLQTSSSAAALHHPTQVQQPTGHHPSHPTRPLTIPPEVVDRTLHLQQAVYDWGFREGYTTALGQDAHDNALSGSHANPQWWDMYERGVRAGMTLVQQHLEWYEPNPSSNLFNQHSERLLHSSQGQEQRQRPDQGSQLPPLLPPTSHHHHQHHQHLHRHHGQESAPFRSVMLPPLPPDGPLPRLALGQAMPARRVSTYDVPESREEQWIRLPRIVNSVARSPQSTNNTETQGILTTMEPAAHLNTSSSSLLFLPSLPASMTGTPMPSPLEWTSTGVSSSTTPSAVPGTPRNGSVPMMDRLNFLFRALRRDPNFAHSNGPVAAARQHDEQKEQEEQGERSPEVKQEPDSP